MKLASPTNLRLFTLVSLLIALSTGLILGSYIRSVQATCSFPTHLSATTPRWQPYTSVPVIYDQTSNFTLAEITAMNVAFTNWNAHNHLWGNTSGVVFTGFNQGPAPNYDTATGVVHVHKSPDSSFTPPAIGR